MRYEEIWGDCYQVDTPWRLIKIAFRLWYFRQQERIRRWLQRRYLKKHGSCNHPSKMVHKGPRSTNAAIICDQCGWSLTKGQCLLIGGESGIFDYERIIELELYHLIDDDRWCKTPVHYP